MDRGDDQHAQSGYPFVIYPGILVGGLSFAFAFGPLGSLPLAMIFHWIGNFLFQMVFLITAVLGSG